MQCMSTLKMEVDKKIIKKLIETLEELKKTLKGKDFSSIEDTQSVVEEIVETGTVITSPIVGTAYLAPEPGAKTFVEVGKKIKKGDSVMIVEAMKTMNHVPSTLDGTVSKILVKDGEPVEFGQPLISVK